MIVCMGPLFFTNLIMANFDKIHTTEFQRRWNPILDGQRIVPFKTIN